MYDRSKFSAPNIQAIVKQDITTNHFWTKDMQELTASKYQGHHGPVLSLDVSADDTCLLSGSEDHTARLWDVRENHKRRASLCIQTHGEVLSVAFAPPVLSKATKENEDVHLASVFAQDHSV